MDNKNNQRQKDGLVVLAVKPMEKPYIATIPKDSKSLQKEVVGNIEVLYPFENPTAIVLNREGKLNGMPPNRGIYDGRGQICDIIAGTFLVTGMAENDFGSLDEKLAEKYRKMFRMSEMFFCHHGRIAALPVEIIEVGDTRRAGKRRGQEAADRNKVLDKKGMNFIMNL